MIKSNDNSFVEIKLLLWQNESTHITVVNTQKHVWKLQNIETFLLATNNFLRWILEVI